MNAVLQPEATLHAMRLDHLVPVMHIESRCYSFPWSHGNFVDSLAAGYLARVLLGRDGAMFGYFVAMPGVGEMHLLNLTVAPEQQGRGHASTLLDALEQACRDARLAQLWLEVRQGNQRALTLYGQRGFTQMGVRRHYYPAATGRREDAVVMRAWIAGVAPHAVD